MTTGTGEHRTRSPASPVLSFSAGMAALVRSWKAHHAGPEERSHRKRRNKETQSVTVVVFDRWINEGAKCVGITKLSNAQYSSDTLLCLRVLAAA